MIRLGFPQGSPAGRSAPCPVDVAERSLEQAGLLGKRLLVSLSGGCDSVCLLHILSEIARRRGGLVHAVHVDHGLRPDSGTDADFCRSLSADLAIPFHLFRLAAGQFRRGESVQAEARRLRRSALEGCLARERLDAVALGHHRDDQVETVLYRLLRGTATRGASGMSVWDPPYVRPLLPAGREELRTLAGRNGWAYREDPSNASERFVRNRLRRRVLPLLRAVMPGAEEALLRFAERMAEDDDALSGLATEALTRWGAPEPEGFRLPVAGLAGLSTAVRRRVYLAAWTRLGCDPHRLETRHLEAVDVLLEDGRAHRRAPVPGPGFFFRSYGDLWVLRPGSLDRHAVSARLTEPGTCSIGEDGALIWSASPPPGSRALRIPAGRPVGDLLVRSWTPGDRVAGRKVKDLLMEARLPVWRRGRALLVGDGAEVFGVLAPGFVWSAEGAGGGGVWLESPPPRPGRRGRGEGEKSG